MTLGAKLLVGISPNDRFDLLVKSDGTTSCAAKNYSANIANVSNNGINVSVASLLARAATMYIQRKLVNATRINLQELNLTYALFAFVSPQIINNNGKNRLAIVKSENSRLQAIVTETMAIGATLLAGENVFSIPLKFWYPTPKLQRFDFEATFNGSAFGLEAKGRIDCENLYSAKSSIEKKLAYNVKSKQYHHALGVIYSPSLINCINKHDIVVIDPDEHLAPLDEFANTRSILRHYSIFYKMQGYLDVYKSISSMTKPENIGILVDYLNGGFRDLKPGKKWRTRFKVRGEAYLGTAWSDKDSLSTSVHITDSEGGYMWGIKEDIHNAIISGDIGKILETSYFDDDFWDDEYRYILMGDGSAVGWAPSLDKLLNMP